MKTFGPQAIEFIERFCHLPKGDNYGEPVKLAQFQKDIYNRALQYEIVNGKPKLIYNHVLIGMPKGSGKSPTAAFLAAFMLCSGFHNDPQVAIAAASFSQADIIFGDLRTICTLSPQIRQSVDVFDTKINLKGSPGRAFRAAAVRGTNDGLHLSCFIGDETHEWNDAAKRGQFLVLSNAATKRFNSLVISTTTAGSDLDSLLGELYMRGKRIEAGEEAHNGFLMIWFDGPELDSFDWNSDEELRAALSQAYPSPWTDIDRILMRCREMPVFEAARYYLNRWTRSEESWLPPNAWESCREDFELDADLPSFVGVDMALRHDSIAVVITQKQGDKYAVSSKVWQPAEQVVDVATVENYLRELHRNYNVVEFGFDPAYFQRSAEILLDEGLPMVEFPQSGSRMQPACGQGYELIVTNQIKHNGDPTLTDHVLSAAQKQTDTGWRLSKGRSKRKIDACIAMIMALDLASSRATAAPMIYIF